MPFFFVIFVTIHYSETEQGRERNQKRSMMETGIKGKLELIVTDRLTAKNIGSGTVKVLATPAMIALMEMTCRTSVKPYLDSGMETVGTHVNVSHENAVPVGSMVWCESELIEIDRRKLTFRVVVYGDKGIVGRGTLERFIVDEKKFSEKAKKQPMAD